MNQTDRTAIVTQACTMDDSDYDYDDITPQYYVSEQDQESICSDDNRTRVTSTRLMPYKAICKLYIRAANGRNYIGTGWLVARNKLYTAGHCVYSHRADGWAKSVIVVPGQSGRSKPYGSYIASEMLTTKVWLKTEDPRSDNARRYDIGAIKLSSNVNHRDFLQPSLSDVDTVTICGYPGDRDTGIFQYKMQDDVKKEDGRFLYYIDTFGGQSGSPLLKNRSVAIGIHNYGGCENSGSDLFPEFIECVNNW